ncbi:MAG: NADH-quinone oxidoreductase subunit N [Ilumatobacteraceae bacterium]
MSAGLVAALQGPGIDWISLSPLLVLLGGAMALLVVSALTRPWPRHLAAVATAVVAVAVGALTVMLWHQVDREGPVGLVGNALDLDKVTLWLTMTVAVALFLAALITDGYLEREGFDGVEPYALYMLAAIGAIVMGAANDLIVLFLGLEILSLALYILAASHRRRLASQESGLKYFILGGFASAFFLYGAALVYGATGSTNFSRIVEAFNAAVNLDRADDSLVLAGVALIIVGLGFKVAAVPFHFWTPDVYQGAPTPVTAFMASAAKAAAFVAMLRLTIATLGHWSDDYRPVLWALAAITVVVGSVMAVVQTDVKRMLAFSSISHAGFILVGVEAAAHEPGSLVSGGVSAVLLYVLVYAVLVLGTFAVVSVVGRTGEASTDLAGFRGLGRERPLLALAMTVLLLAQAGVPLTSGFVAKFSVIEAAVEVESYSLAVVAMVAAVIAAYLYLRIMVSMWVADAEPGDAAREVVVVPRFVTFAVALSVAATLVIGVYPGPLVSLVP